MPRLSRRPARPASRCLNLEALERRELLNGTTLTPPTDLDHSRLGIIAQAEYMQNGGDLNRSDVINLLDVTDWTEEAVVAPDGNSVTFMSIASPGSRQPYLLGADLTALQTLAHDYTKWDLPADVANLTGKVVGHDLASRVYQGQTILPSGELSATMTKGPQLMVDLVDKWFYGDDLPSTAGFKDPTTGQPLSYKPAAGTLFGSSGVPQYSDVAQGYVNDCYFMSSLGELALQSPKTIESMFTANGDGTWTVRFYEGKTADYVTVNDKLPVTSTGQLYFAGWYQNGTPENYKGSSNVLWVSLAEKAYAQLAAEGWSRPPTGKYSSGFIGDGVQHPDVNAYAAIGIGSSEVALEQISGVWTAGDYVFSEASNKRILINAFENGDAVVMGTPGSYPSKTPHNDATNPLIPSHVYTLTAVDTNTGSFTFTNPYDDGTAQSGDGARTVEMTWTQLEKYARDFVVLKP